MYLFLDTESGGPGPEYSILEFCLICADNDLVSFRTFDTQVEPDDGIYHVSRDGLICNRIDLTQHRGVKYRDAGKLLYEKLIEWGATPKTTTVVGHGIKGDLDIIFKYIISRGTWESFVSSMPIDTCGLYKVLQALGKIPPENTGSLQELAKHYEIATGVLHRALKDTILTRDVFIAMMEDLKRVQT